MSLPKPPAKEIKSSWIGAVVEPSMEEKLTRYAKKHNITKSEAIRFIMASFFNGSFQKSIVDVGSQEVSIEGVE